MLPIFMGIFNFIYIIFNFFQVKKADFAHDPYVQYFGMKVKPQLTLLEGRVIEPPVIQYGNEVREWFV